MNSTCLPKWVIRELAEFIHVTAAEWIDANKLKPNAYGVELLVAEGPGRSFSAYGTARFGSSALQANPMKGEDWYRANAHGKDLICLETGLDSDVAVRQAPGLVAGIEGAFPWGGAVIDKTYGLIVGVSGFKEDEDKLFARTILNYLIMLLDRHGQVAINDARRRGDQEGEAGADRFIRAA